MKKQTTAQERTWAGRSVPGVGIIGRVGLAGMALTGLHGCNNDDDKGSGAESDLDALCKGMVDDALSAQEEEFKGDLDLDALCADMVSLASDGGMGADLDKLCMSMVQEATDALTPQTPEEKTTSAEQKEYTFAELTAMCDDRGGYVQVHGSCAYVNSCKGFSFGDWGPDAATLTEHTCSGVNGCKGLSCVELPEDEGRTPEALLDMEFMQPGPGACTNCHAVDEEDVGRDETKFKLLLPKGSARTVDNWLDRPAAEQERVIAFGSHGIAENGVAFAYMSAYKDVMSRGEIERLVAHIRTLTPVIKEIKTEDP